MIPLVKVCCSLGPFTLFIRNSFTTSLLESWLSDLAEQKLGFLMRAWYVEDTVFQLALTRFFRDPRAIRMQFDFHDVTD